MINYNDLYELLRKEKYSETLQQLPKNFIDDFAIFLNDKKEENSAGDLFSEGVIKNKKQFENSVAIFKELMLRRKKKLLNLVFVATETGVMKRDYENMLDHEREIFEKMMKAFEEGDKGLTASLTGKKHEENNQKLVIFSQDIEQFVDYSGLVIGPFAAGELANLDIKIAEILIGGGKASYVDSD
jgi:hypothetical protein